MGIVSLDGCPSEVVGDVDLSKCISLKSLDGMPVSITGGDLAVPKMINDGYTELNSSHWFSDDSFIPVLKPYGSLKKQKLVTVYIYDDSGSDTNLVKSTETCYSTFENLCFISDILRKNHGHVIVKVTLLQNLLRGKAVYELYNGSVDANMAE